MECNIICPYSNYDHIILQSVFHVKISNNKLKPWGSFNINCRGINYSVIWYPFGKLTSLKVEIKIYTEVYKNYTSWSLLLVGSSCSSKISIVVVDCPSIITKEFTSASAAGFLFVDFFTRRNLRFPRNVLVNLK